MQDFEINVTQVEEWQTLNDRDALEALFEKAQRVVVGGGTVILLRRHPNGKKDPFDSFTTEEDLASYKKNVLKYMD